jgi:uncharacterized protein YuzE
MNVKYDAEADVLIFILRNVPPVKPQHDILNENKADIRE